MNHNKSIYLLVLFLPTFLFSQDALQIDGPEGVVGFGEIAELRTNVDIKVDDSGRPSHSIIWKVDEPRELRSKAKLYEKGSILAIPTGCKVIEVYVSVQVINWEDRRVEVKDFSFKVGNENNPPPQDDDDDNNPPPVDSDFKKALTDSFLSLPETNRNKFKDGVTDNILSVIDELNKGTYGDGKTEQSISKLSRDLSNKNIDLYGNTQAFKEWSKFWLVVQEQLTKKYKDSDFDLKRSLEVIIQVLESN